MRQRLADGDRRVPAHSRNRPRAALLSIAVALAGFTILVVPSQARAEPASSQRQAKNFIGLGPLFGITGHVDTPIAGALGFEISYIRYPVEAFRFGLGAFAQAQTVGFSHARWAIGPQINFMMFGAELGAFVEEGAYGRAATIGMHASPFVSIGFLSAALRIGVPVSALSGGTPYGLDLGLVFAIKAPIPLDGQLFGLAFH